MKARLRASLIHLAASGLVAALAAALVFALWYPMPYREASGGRELFLLMVAVDVVLGPLITLAVFDPRKPRAELMRDLGVVVLLQLAALAYGLHTVALARPAVVALEGNRLRVVRPVDLEQADFSRAPPELGSLSWWGPLLVAARPPTAAEQADAIGRGLAGEDIGMRPEFWRPDRERGTAFASAAQPLDKLTRLWPQHSAQLQRAVEATGRPRDQLGYLPILARRTDWSVLVDLKDGSVVGYVPIDGF
jgi:hypothetical protein